MTIHHTHTSRQQGFTMVEVLVTLIVLSIGLLGLAGLQLNALRNNDSAYHRSQATMLAYDIIDRMMTNSALAKAGSYNTALGAPSTTSCHGAATCSPVQLAQHDINAWKCAIGKWDAEAFCAGAGISGDLPDGDGSVLVNGGVATVTITWEDKRDRTANRLTTLTVSSELP